MDEPKEPAPEVVTTKTTTVAEGVQTTTPRHDSTPRNLAYMTTAGEIAVLYAFLFVPIPLDNHDAVLMLVSSYTTGWGLMMGYWYATSAGSEQRNAIRASKP